MQACHQVEVHSRVESILRMKEDNVAVADLTDGSGNKESLISKDEKLKEIVENYKPVITNRSLQINDLVENTLGKTWLHIWTIILCATIEIVIAA